MDGSVACGTGSEYTGDWSAWTEQSCHELCFDINIFFVCTVPFLGCDDTRVQPSIRLQGGPPNYLRADFKVYDFMTETDGWRRICAPLGSLDSDGNLPSNEIGYWVMGPRHNVLAGSTTLSYGASPSPNTTWTDLLSDITAIMLPIDFNGQTSERFGYDNICLVESESVCETPPPTITPTQSVRYLLVHVALFFASDVLFLSYWHLSQQLIGYNDWINLLSQLLLLLWDNAGYCHRNAQLHLILMVLEVR